MVCGALTLAMGATITLRLWKWCGVRTASTTKKTQCGARSTQTQGVQPSLTGMQTISVPTEKGKTMKEKLIELLITAKDLITLTRQAEFLIANGVTIPVRCKECIHMKERFNARYCEVWTTFNGMGDEGFCNYGLRRESE